MCRGRGSCKGNKQGHQIWCLPGNLHVSHRKSSFLVFNFLSNALKYCSFHDFAAILLGSLHLPYQTRVSTSSVPNLLHPPGRMNLAPKHHRENPFYMAHTASNKKAPSLPQLHNHHLECHGVRRRRKPSTRTLALYTILYCILCY